MTLLDILDIDGKAYEYWKDDNCFLVRVQINENGEEIGDFEDMGECACAGCWENR